MQSALESVKIAIQKSGDAGEDEQETQNFKKVYEKLPENEKKELDEYNKKGKEFNKISYINQLCSILYMMNKDMREVILQSEQGVKLCEEFDYPVLNPEVLKIKEDLQNIAVRAHAISKNTNAYEIQK